LFKNSQHLVKKIQKNSGDKIDSHCTYTKYSTSRAEFTIQEQTCWSYVESTWRVLGYCRLHRVLGVNICYGRILWLHHKTVTSDFSYCMKQCFSITQDQDEMTTMTPAIVTTQQTQSWERQCRCRDRVQRQFDLRAVEILQLFTC